MRILIGTTNPSKAGYFETLLADTGASFVTPRELGITEELRETGGTPEENKTAEQLEKAYTERLKAFLRQALGI